MFDSNGHYSLTIMRSDLPKFAAKTADQGTADENKAVLQGMITHFGTYSVNEADKTLTTRIEGSSFPKSSRTEQKRIIASLTADELKYTNPATATELELKPRGSEPNRCGPRCCRGAIRRFEVRANDQARV